MHERFDDWMALETAIIELAKDSGWDLDEAMNSDWVEEQMNNGTGGSPQAWFFVGKKQCKG